MTPHPLRNSNRPVPASLSLRAPEHAPAQPSTRVSRSEFHRIERQRERLTNFQLRQILAQPNFSDRILGVVRFVERSWQSTRYNHQDSFNTTEGVYESDCSEFITWILRRVAPQALEGISRPRHPVVSDFTRHFERTGSPGGNPYLQAIPEVIRIEPGDLIAWRTPNGFPSNATGHIVVAVSRPIPFANGYLVRVADFTSYPHENDSREGGSGFGYGTMFFQVDAQGHGTGYGWRGRSSVPQYILNTAIRVARVVSPNPRTQESLGNIHESPLFVGTVADLSSLRQRANWQASQGDVNGLLDTLQERRDFIARQSLSTNDPRFSEAMTPHLMRQAYRNAILPLFEEARSSFSRGEFPRLRDALRHIEEAVQRGNITLTGNQTSELASWRSLPSLNLLDLRPNPYLTFEDRLQEIASYFRERRQGNQEISVNQVRELIRQIRLDFPQISHDQESQLQTWMAQAYAEAIQWRFHQAEVDAARGKVEDTLIPLDAAREISGQWNLERLRRGSNPIAFDETRARQLIRQALTQGITLSFQNAERFAVAGNEAETLLHLSHAAAYRQRLGQRNLNDFGRREEILSILHRDTPLGRARHQLFLANRAAAEGHETQAQDYLRQAHIQIPLSPLSQRRALQQREENVRRALEARTQERLRLEARERAEEPETQESDPPLPNEAP